MAKPTGAICNLDCSYCFFLSKELLYPGDRFRMADGVLASWIRQTIEAHRTPEVVIAFQGGEPTLLGVDFFRRAVLHARKVAGSRPLQFTIQTNGTLLDDAWADFLADEGFLVGLSIDGPAEMHDRHRVDKHGRPTYDRVREAWDLLRRHDVDTNILCTVSSSNADSPLEVYRHFRDDLGAAFIQLIPIVERATPVTIGHANQGWRADPFRPSPVHPDRRSGHRTQRHRRAVGSVPGRRVRRVGQQRRRRRVHPHLRVGAGVVAGHGGSGVRVQRDMRERAGPGAQRRRLLL
ncbi:MAG: radical SAM protein [Microthrixaceae bacterium]